jgi:hypothetical protein
MTTPYLRYEYHSGQLIMPKKMVRVCKPQMAIWFLKIWGLEIFFVAKKSKICRTGQMKLP